MILSLNFQPRNITSSINHEYLILSILRLHYFTGRSICYSLWNLLVRLNQGSGSYAIVESRGEKIAHFGSGCGFSSRLHLSKYWPLVEPKALFFYIWATLMAQYLFPKHSHEHVFYTLKNMQIQKKLVSFGNISFVKKNLLTNINKMIV